MYIYTHIRADAMKHKQLKQACYWFYNTALAGKYNSESPILIRKTSCLICSLSLPPSLFVSNLVFKYGRVAGLLENNSWEKHTTLLGKRSKVKKNGTLKSNICFATRHSPGYIYTFHTIYCSWREPMGYWNIACADKRMQITNKEGSPLTSPFQMHCP